MESGTSHETERNPDSVSVRKFQHYQKKPVVQFFLSYERRPDPPSPVVSGLLSYDRKFLHSEETILKMPAFMRAPKQDDY